MARSKEFDEQVVLDSATQIFLKLGYEKTSMQNLVDGMGIKRGSLYDTFGDKKKLFTRCLANFSTQIAASNQLRTSEKKNYRDKIMAILTSFSQSPTGCLLVNTAAELGFLEPDIQEIIASEFLKTKQLLQTYIELGQENGEFKSQVTADLLAETIHNASIGLRVFGKINQDQELLQQIIRINLTLLDT